MVWIAQTPMALKPSVSKSVLENQVFYGMHNRIGGGGQGAGRGWSVEGKPTQMFSSSNKP